MFDPTTFPTDTLQRILADSEDDGDVATIHAVRAELDRRAGDQPAILPVDREGW